MKTKKEMRAYIKSLKHELENQTLVYSFVFYQTAVETLKGLELIPSGVHVFEEFVMNRSQINLMTEGSTPTIPAQDIIRHEITKLSASIPITHHGRCKVILNEPWWSTK